MAINISSSTSGHPDAVIFHLEETTSDNRKTSSINPHFGEPVPVFSNGERRFSVSISKHQNKNLLLESYRKAGAKATEAFRLLNSERLIISGKVSEDAKLAFAEGFSLGSYQFNRYKSESKASAPNELFIEGISDEGAERLNILVKAVFETRNLVNEPPAMLTPVRMAEAFSELGNSCGFKTEVLEKRQIEALKMGGLIAVNKGSAEPPVFTIMTYKPKGAINKKPYVLVGKGVTFDSGGLNIKTMMMEVMKSDMAGAAAVAGALSAIALSKLPVYIIGIVPATDNRPGPDAVAPGDIITTCDGTTVEILNTDAEGRLILADAISYAHKYDPEAIIDLATLTGAAMRAIGTAGTVAMGTLPDNLKKILFQSGHEVHERLVEFPLWDEYGEQIKTPVADIANLGGPLGGAITAGKFLQHFAKDVPWMHLDIAGPSFLDKKEAYRTKGGTGTGVRLLHRFFENLIQKHGK